METGRLPRLQAQQEALEIAERLGEDQRNGPAKVAPRSPIRWRIFWSLVMPSRHGASPKPVDAKVGVCCAKCVAMSWNCAKAITARSGCKSSANA